MHGSVSATVKYDEPRLKMSHSGAVARTTVLRLFRRVTNH